MSLSQRLNKRVTIQQKSTTPDEIGQPIETWTNFVTAGDGKVWAEVNDVSGREYVAAGANQSAVLTKITIRYRAGVVSSMRVLHGTDTYSIEAALQQGPRDMLLMCKRLAA